MKFTIVITILDIDKQTLSLIDNIYSQTIDDLQIVLSIPNIFNKKEVEELKDHFKNIDNIEILELENDNINYGRNKAILRSNSEYIMFINSNEKISESNILKIIYNEMTSNQLDIITYDSIFISTYEGNNFEIDNIKSKKVLNTKNRFIENKIYSGEYLYKKLIEKHIFSDSLSLYSYRVEFLRKNNLMLDEDLVSSTLLFIVNSIIKCTNIKYFSYVCIEEHKYKSIFINGKFLKYNCIENTFIMVDKLLDLSIDFENLQLQPYIFRQIFNLLIGIFFRIKENLHYNYIDRIYDYLQKIKLLLNNKDIIDLDIRINMIIDSFQTYERFKSDIIKHQGKNCYNDIHSIQEILNYISKYKSIDEDSIKLLTSISDNSHYSKFKSGDILKNNILYGCRDIIDLETLKSNIKDFQNDIESIVNDKLVYYRYFESEFEEILRNI